MSLSTVEISPTSKVRSFGGQAFYGCMKLRSLFIPTGVTVIQGYLCEGCSSLKSLTIPDTAQTIEWGAFYGATKLKCINWNSSIQRNLRCCPDPLPTLKECLSASPTVQPTLSGQLVRYACTNVTGCCQGNTDIFLSSAVIPSKALKGCANIASVVMDSTVKSIMDEAFSGLTSLRSVFIPSTVKVIG